MKLPYRSEIDGLRTIAVLSVILYHAQIVVFGHDFFKGGFVGVDIFFVISGYLISRILLSELFEKGKISFLQFYERRARRILPILFFVFLVFYPFAYRYLLPNQFIEYAQSILSATFFGSNIFFYFTNTQYGAEDSLLQPFLHTWSLGVEEQFYILFPIVLLLAYKFAKNHLVTIIAVLILISIQYADWQSTKNTQLNFFMLTSRLWELGIGSLLAFYELKYGRVKHKLLNQTMPLLGLAMIAHAIVFFNNQTPHPSFITLLPTLGTALIILYSVNKTDLVGKVLSWKPIVGIGLISYSMYLWHYPIFAFARMADTNGLHNDEKYLLILLTIVISIVSYFLIEKPFRNRHFLNIKKFSVITFILLIAVLGINWKIIESDGLKIRFTEDELNTISYFDAPEFRSLNHPTNKDGLHLRTNKNRVNCNMRDPNDACRFGNEKIIFLGDSFVGVYERALIKETDDLNLGFISFNYEQCPYVSSTIWFGNVAECSYVNDERKKIISKFDDKKIFIISANTEQFKKPKKRTDNPIDDGRKNFKDGIILDDKEKGIAWDSYLENIKFLAEKGHEVIVITFPPNPLIKKGDITNIINTKNYAFIRGKLEPLTNKTNPNNFRLDELKKYETLTHKNIHVIKLTDLLCDVSKCYDINDGRILYNEGHHLSYFGAKKIVTEIRKIISESNNL